LVSFSTRNWRGFRVLLAALVFVLVFWLFYEAPISATSSENTCIGLGAWPCGYTGPFSGEYYAGYATLGCTPTSANGTCVVPQIAMVTSFLVINNTSYVIDWANQTFQGNNHLTDGSTISVSGYLTPIMYNKTTGSTYIIFYSNAKKLLNPQPQLQIENATLTTQPIAVTYQTSYTQSSTSMPRSETSNQLTTQFTTTPVSSYISSSSSTAPLQMPQPPQPTSSSQATNNPPLALVLGVAFGLTVSLGAAFLYSKRRGQPERIKAVDSKTKKAGTARNSYIEEAWDF